MRKCYGRCKIDPVLLRILIFTTAATLWGQGTGANVYAARCASCHEAGGARIPSRDSLGQLTSARILKTLDFGFKAFSFCRFGVWIDP